MAFTFIIEDGTCREDATSYASVDEADDYLIINKYAYEKWVALNSTQKEHLLAWASRYLDQHTRWVGKRKNPRSGLRWPRSSAVDKDGNLIADTVIPLALKEATIEMAKSLLDADRSADIDQNGIKRIRIDVIEVFFDDNYHLPTVPAHINQILSGLGKIQGKSGFGKILRT